MYMNMYTIIGM